MTRLPIELQAQILEHLPNFSSLFSAIQTHSNMYNAYSTFDCRILHTIFRRRCDKTKQKNIGLVFWELVFATRHAFIRREIVEDVFIMGWELFRTRNLEELLLPLGRALAWSYWQEGEAEMEAKTEMVDAMVEVASEDEDGAEWEVIHEGGHRKEDAISLLDKLVHGRAPFDHQPPLSRSKYPEELRQRWPRATVQPILELLNKWTDNKEKVVV